MWNDVRCAVRGRGHIKADVPCQDKTFSLQTENINIISLADGAGSACNSHFGAELVTERICNLLERDFDLFYNENDGVAVKRIIVGSMLEGLNDLSKKMNCEKKDLASTLLVAAVKDDKYIILHIGDGVIGFMRDDELKVASIPENGEFVNTTVFVTSKDALQTMKILKGNLKGIEGFVLMSDGTETSLYDKKGKCLAPALKNLMLLLRTMKKDCLERQIQLTFENVIKQNTTDDCSIAIMIKDDENFKGYMDYTTQEKEKILGIQKGRFFGSRVKKYDKLLRYMEEPKNIAQVSKMMFLKKKYCKRHLDLLVEKNLVMCDEGMYQTSIILEK